MSQSLTQIYLHLVFHVSYTSPKIKEEDSPRLYAYLNRIALQLDCPAITIGGMPDHIHLLCRMGKETSLSSFIRELKASSSKWIKTLALSYRGFSWQRGYGVFSVSPSSLERVTHYIAHQKEHHAHLSMEDEYTQLLELAHIPYDPQYLWDK